MDWLCLQKHMTVTDTGTLDNKLNTFFFSIVPILRTLTNELQT